MTRPPRDEDRIISQLAYVEAGVGPQEKRTYGLTQSVAGDGQILVDGSVHAVVAALARLQGTGDGSL
jgi:hypothetical protein